MLGRLFLIENPLFYSETQPSKIRLQSQQSRVNRLESNNQRIEKSEDSCKSDLQEQKSSYTRFLRGWDWFSLRSLYGRNTLYWICLGYRTHAAVGMLDMKVAGVSVAKKEVFAIIARGSVVEKMELAVTVIVHNLRSKQFHIAEVVMSAFVKAGNHFRVPS